MIPGRIGSQQASDNTMNKEDETRELCCCCYSDIYATRHISLLGVKSSSRACSVLRNVTGGLLRLLDSDTHSSSIQRITARKRMCASDEQQQAVATHREAARRERERDSLIATWRANKFRLTYTRGEETRERVRMCVDECVCNRERDERSCRRKLAIYM